jgi:hypothetical protein
MAVRQAPRPLGVLLLAILAASSLGSLAGFLRGDRRHLGLVDEGPDSAAFLRAVRAATGRPEARDVSLLNPPEHDYPVGVSANAVLFSYSRRPGFLPDFRHLQTRERYFNRVALFCFLFPGYPAFDLHLGRSACEEPLDPPREVVTLRDPGLRAAILPVYAIGYAAAPGRPFPRFLKQAQTDYGWEDVAGGPGKQRLLRTEAPARPGLAHFARGRWGQAGLFVGLETDTGGPQVVVLGGRGLAERADRVLLDGEELEARARSANWAVYEADIVRGPHRLELLWPERSAARDADYLYFAAVVAMSHASGYLDLPAQRRTSRAVAE